jgi:hypothetical protein
MLRASDRIALLSDVGWLLTIQIRANTTVNAGGTRYITYNSPFKDCDSHSTPPRVHPLTIPRLHADEECISLKASNAAAADFPPILNSHEHMRESGAVS